MKFQPSLLFKIVLYNQTIIIMSQQTSTSSLAFTSKSHCFKTVHSNGRMGWVVGYGPNYMGKKWRIVYYNDFRDHDMERYKLTLETHDETISEINDPIWDLLQVPPKYRGNTASKGYFCFELEDPSSSIDPSDYTEGYLNYATMCSTQYADDVKEWLNKNKFTTEHLFEFCDYFTVYNQYRLQTPPSPPRRNES